MSRLVPDALPLLRCTRPEKVRQVRPRQVSLFLRAGLEGYTLIVSIDSHSQEGVIVDVAGHVASYSSCVQFAYSEAASHQ
jgi:hypothetical protein